MIYGKYNKYIRYYFFQFMAWWFLVLGSIMVIMNLIALFMVPSPFELDSLIGQSTVLSVLYVAIPALLALLGWLIIKAKPFKIIHRPKLSKQNIPYEIAKQPWE